jgi:uncharacterized membrane protein YdbT with pleckstrin-like domain
MNINKLIHLKDDEQVLHVVRNYWLVYLPPFLLGFLLIAAALFLMLPLFSLGLPGLVLFFTSVLVGIYYGVRTLVIWYWNVFIITTFRIVDVNQSGFFRRSVAEAAYDKVQDVTYGIDGLCRSLLNFGAVHLETAGGGAALDLADVHDPKEVNHLITEAMGWHALRRDGGARGTKVAELLATVAELSDTEAKAFLVAIQQAMGRDSDVGEAAERSSAVAAWTAESSGGSEGEEAIFRHDVIDD